MAEALWSQGTPSPAGDLSAEVAGERDSIHIVRLRMSQPAPIDLERVPAIFGTAARSWLGEAAGADAAGRLLFRSDLRLRVSPESRALFRKSAIVGLGVPRWTGERWSVPIEWRAATLAPLFPVFAGHLVIDASGITLHGYYAPPFGAIGYAVDRAVLSIAARGTARWFLSQIAEAVRTPA